MALSGSFNTTNYDGRYLTFAWTATQNQENNTSTISWTLTGNGNAGVGYYYAGAFKVVIGTETVYSSSTRIPLYAGTKVASGTKVITHNPDGTMSFSASAEAGIYYYAINCRGSGSWTLDPIQRGAYIETAPNFTDEDNPTITYVNPFGNDVEALEACISFTGGNDDVPYRAISKTGTSYTFNLTEEERETLRNTTFNPDGTRTIAFYIRTKINNNTYWSSSIKTLTLVNGAPVVEVSLYDTNEKTNVLTGDPTKRFVQGFSNVSYSISAYGSKGASIASYRVECGPYLNTAEVGIFNGFNPNGATAMRFTVTDSRGIVTVKELKFTVVKHELPYVWMNDAQKVETSSGGIYFDVYGAYFADWFDGTTNGSLGGKKNRVIVQYRYKIQGSEDDYTEWRDNTGTITTKMGGEPEDEWWTNQGYELYESTVSIEGLDYTATYVIQIRAIDLAVSENTPSEEYILNMVPVFHWGKGDFTTNVPFHANAPVMMLDHDEEYSEVLAYGESQHGGNEQPGLIIGQGNYNKANENPDYLGKYDTTVCGGSVLVQATNDISLIPNGTGGYLSANSENITIGGDVIRLNPGWNGYGNLTDFVIESGDDGAYAYRMWYSGVIEAWRTSTSVISFDTDVAYGSSYYSGTTYTLRTTGGASQFVAIRSVQLTAQKAPGTYGFCQPVIDSYSMSNGQVTVNFIMTDPKKITDGYVTPHVYIIGKWKK